MARSFASPPTGFGCAQVDDYVERIETLKEQFSKAEAEVTG